MMVYKQMSDFEIEKAVTILNDIDIRNADSYEWDESQKVFWPEGRGSVSVLPYCHSPSDAWPIIVDNLINIEYYDHPDQQWRAGASFTLDDAEDKNPLRAAMIVFLMMKDSENG